MSTTPSQPESPAEATITPPASAIPPLLRHYRRLSSSRLGRWLFARLICWRAPYFATIRPRFLELRPGFCQVMLYKRRAVQNHLGTVHAIAMANLCEIAAGVLMEASIPANMRWIPRGMTIEYLKKAATDVTAQARLDKTTWLQAQDVGVPITLTDKHGNEVVRAVISMYVSPKPRPAQLAGGVLR